MGRRGPRITVTDEEIENWCKLYQAGLSLARISIKDPKHRSTQTIKRRIEQRIELRPPGCVPRKSWGVVKPEDVDRWQKMYEIDEMTFHQIGIKEQRSSGTIAHYLKERGVKPRPAGMSKKRRDKPPRKAKVKQPDQAQPIEPPQSSFRSPVRYPGGKASMADDILAHFPDPLPELIVSGFIGGGGLELRLCKLGCRVIACDLEAGVAAFWQTLKADGGGAQLARVARDYYARFDDSKAAAIIWFNAVKTEYREIAELGTFKAGDRRRLAALFYVINRVSRDGIFTSGSIASDNNYPPDDCRSWLPRFQLSNIAQLERFIMPENLEVYHCDYAELLRQYPEAFFYGDPPYYANGNCKLYGNDGQLHKGFDHIRLRRELWKRQAGWLLSYDTPAAELYPGNEMIELEMNKAIGSNKGRRVELLIKSGF